MADMPFAAPEISQLAFQQFHEKHFSEHVRSHFSSQFLGPVSEGPEYEVEGDDELGYYADGAPRTLTDDQIAIFRHSEIEAILRKRRHKEDAKQAESPSASTHTESISAETEDGEVEEDANNNHIHNHTEKLGFLTSAAESSHKPRKLSKKQRKAQYAKERGFFKRQIKPDLRKRTWDKVETGMDSLAYDDNISAASASSLSTQRRRISYDDD